MEAKDLRIGNWIIDFFDVKNQEERQIDFDDFHMMGNYKRSEQSIRPRFNHKLPFKPIPLTEEWLVKFGFEKDGWHISDYQIEINKELDWYLELSKNSDSNWLSHISNGNEKSNLPKYIKYAHQLQNLYFALTGEELEIKPSEDDFVKKQIERSRRSGGLGKRDNETSKEQLDRINRFRCGG